MRGGQLRVAKADPSLRDVAFVKDHHGKVHHQTRTDDRDQFHDLNRSRCAAEDPAHLEVLKQFAGNRRRDADDRRDPEHGDDPARSGHTQRHHEERRDDQRRKRKPRDWIVGGADHPHEIAGDGREEEARNQHHDRRYDSAGDETRHVHVEDRHQHEQQSYE